MPPRRPGWSGLILWRNRPVRTPELYQSGSWLGRAGDLRTMKWNFHFRVYSFLMFRSAEASKTICNERKPICNDTHRNSQALGAEASKWWLSRSRGGLLHSTHWASCEEVTYHSHNCPSGALASGGLTTLTETDELLERRPQHDNSLESDNGTFFPTKRTSGAPLFDYQSLLRAHSVEATPMKVATMRLWCACMRARAWCAHSPLPRAQHPNPRLLIHRGPSPLPERNGERRNLNRIYI